MPKTKARIRQNLPLIYRSEKNTDRLITVIGDYPFYQSSGHNSGQAGTFLPFGGIACNCRINFLLFKKPIKEDLKKNKKANNTLMKIPSYFPRILTEFLKINSDNIESQRFGNFETLLISMEMDGGYWLTHEGFKLKNFLCTHFSTQILQIKAKFKTDFSIYKNINRDNITIYEANTQAENISNIIKINNIISKNSTRISTLRHDYKNKIQLIDLTDIDYSDHFFSHDAVMHQPLTPKQNQQNPNNPIDSAKAYCHEYLIYSNNLKKLDSIAQQKRNVAFDMLTYLNDTTPQNAITRLQRVLDVFNKNKQLMLTHRGTSFFTKIYEPRSKHLGEQLTLLYNKLRHSASTHKNNDSMTSTPSI